MQFTRGTRRIFNGIDIDIHRGKITAIMGPSGTGKTTLLKLIGGQLVPEKGSVIVDNHNVHKLKRAQLFAENLGNMMQGSVPTRKPRGRV